MLVSLLLIIYILLLVPYIVIVKVDQIQEVISSFNVGSPYLLINYLLFFINRNTTWPSIGVC